MNYRTSADVRLAVDRLLDAEIALVEAGNAIRRARDIAPDADKFRLSSLASDTIGAKTSVVRARIDLQGE